MKVVLRPLPVLYACQGCAEFVQAARGDARRWLTDRGVTPQQGLVLAG